MTENEILIRSFLGIVLALLFGPTILFCLFPSTIRAWFAAGPEALDTVPPASKKEITLLREMGFVPLGIKAEQSFLRRAIPSFELAAADCYASVIDSGRLARVYFYSVLPDGSFILTSNGTFPTISTRNASQHSYPGLGTQELLKTHLQALTALGQCGQMGASANERIAAAYAYYRNQDVRHTFRRTGIMLLILMSTLATLLFWIT